MLNTLFEYIIRPIFILVLIETILAERTEPVCSLQRRLEVTARHSRHTSLILFNRGGFTRVSARVEVA